MSRSFCLPPRQGLLLALFSTAVAPAFAEAPPPPDDEVALLERAAAIHERVLTLDTHADTPMVLLRPGFDVAQEHSWRTSLSQVDLPRMRAGGMDGIFWACFVPQGPLSDAGYTQAMAQAEAMLAAIEAVAEAHPDAVSIATSADDAPRLEAEGRLALYIGLENGYPIGEDHLSALEALYARGVRYITLCHFTNNQLADASTDPDGPVHDGLSPLGEAVVTEMNRLGIVVDVSHTSDATTWDALERSRAPIIASHSSTRALFDHPRNMNDALLQALAAQGGVIQINGYSDYLEVLEQPPERVAALEALRETYGVWWRVEDPALKAEILEQRIAIEQAHPQARAQLSTFVDHIDHAVAVAGIDHVGVGLDFDGGGGLVGLMEISDMGQLTVELVRRGYSEAEIAKIWGGNFLRVLRENERVARELQGLGDAAAQ